MVDLKVQIGYLRQTIKSSQESFARTQNAHDSLMNAMQSSIEELEIILNRYKELDDA